MSDFRQSDPFSSSSVSADLAAIAAMLAQAAQTLLAFAKTAEPEHAPKAEISQKDDIRCYRFSPLARGCERELFEDQGAQNQQEVLFKAFSAISTLTFLLEQIPAEAELPGGTVLMLVRELKRVENLLFKI